LKRQVIEAYVAEELIGNNYRIRVQELLDQYVNISQMVYNLNQRLRAYDMARSYAPVAARPASSEYQNTLSELPDFVKGLAVLAQQTKRVSSIVLS
jgi:hypothetical protein